MQVNLELYLLNPREYQQQQMISNVTDVSPAVESVWKNKTFLPGMHWYVSGVWDWGKIRVQLQKDLNCSCDNFSIL